MTRVAAGLPRAGTGTGLLLLATALVLVAAWPERGDVANTAWYPLTALRATGLALWAWWAGALAPPRAPADPLDVPLRLAMGAVATAPIEAFAHAASAPTDPLAWSLAAPLLLAWTLFGVATALATLVRRVGWQVVLAPLAVLAAIGLVMLDLRLGLGWWTPWTLPRAPSLGGGLLLTAAAAGVWLVAIRRTRVRGGGAES